MTNTLADFCEVAWEQVIDMACFNVAMEATAITSARPDSPEQMAGVFRLPRAVITEAVDFTERYAAACLEAKRDVPSLPIPDPWDARRRAALEKQVTHAITRIAQLAEHNWALPHRTAIFSGRNARTTLLRELAGRWEQGQRAHHQSLHNGETAPSQTQPALLGANEGTPKKRKRRGPTTEERLKELIASEGGWEKIKACRKAADVGRLIKRSHASVIATRSWQKEICPELKGQRDMARYHRHEREERRRDRQ
jgi:hypothetical protein